MNLKNKKVLIIGVASKRSIATRIAEVFDENGAQLALTYQNEKLQSRVEDIASSLSNTVLIHPCDLSKDSEICQLRDYLQSEWCSIDIIIHSAAFAPRELLGGDFVKNITREGFQIAHDISSYTFTALAREFVGIMNDKSSI